LKAYCAPIIIPKDVVKNINGLSAKYEINTVNDTTDLLSYHVYDYMCEDLKTKTKNRYIKVHTPHCIKRYFGISYCAVSSLIINGRTSILSQNLIKKEHITTSRRRWIVLLGFSLLTFSSACLWITFAPCLYIFMHHYSQATPSYINSLSTIYMIMYPILLLPSLKIFAVWDLHGGLLFGAFLNSLGSFVRFLGSFGPRGFWVLFLGQTIAASGQVFILGLPPKLAITWFDHGEQNLAASIGIMANNAGVAAGSSPSHSSSNSKSVVSLTVFISYFADKPFIFLTTSFGIIIGAQYALSTLLAQMIMPVFEIYDETKIGILGFSIVVAGVVGSFVIGIYLDHSFAYKRSCHVLYIGTIIALGIFNISLKNEILSLAFLSSICFGIFSFAIPSAIFRYATLATSMREGEDEIASTSILNTSAQIWGILLVALMDIAENNDKIFTMELSNWMLFTILVCGAALLWVMDDDRVARKLNVDDEYVEVNVSGGSGDGNNRSNICSNDNDRGSDEELEILEVMQEE
ncbi:5220_t:CDS:2, partial [Entrophospora sp. SA101]